MNIRGYWEYTEEFDNGEVDGTVLISEEDGVYTAEFKINEVDDDGNAIQVIEKAEVEIDESWINFETKSFECDGLKDKEEYLPTERQGLLTEEGRIVGHTWDNEEICGVFKMER
jgi:hypothetical protein